LYFSNTVTLDNEEYQSKSKITEIPPAMASSNVLGSKSVLFVQQENNERIWFHTTWARKQLVITDRMAILHCTSPQREVIY